MSLITTHVLDTARGCPAADVEVSLDRLQGDGEFIALARGVTDRDGRARGLLPDEHLLEVGVYRLTFATGRYARAHGLESFYPAVPVIFEVKDGTQHYHVPLLLSPHGYSTYRGS